MEKEMDRDITPIEALCILPDIVVLDTEYMMLQNQYNFKYKNYELTKINL